MLKDDAINALAVCHPEVSKQIKDLEQEWSPDSPPFVVLMGAVGRTLAKITPSLELDAVLRIAETIELLLHEGTEEVDVATTTGLLEALVHCSDDQPMTLVLLSNLGPRAKAYIRAWDGFTGATTPGM